MQVITKKQFEDIMFNQKMNITVKTVKKGLSYKQVVFNGVDKIAERVITASGVEYFKY